MEQEIALQFVIEGMEAIEQKDIVGLHRLLGDYIAAEMDYMVIQHYPEFYQEVLTILNN